MTEYDIHEAAKIFPLMPEDELDQLAADIQAHGLLEPIIIHDGKILDGRNRERACMMIGLEPTYKIIEMEGDILPIEYVVSKNLHRRHLSPAQRAAVALDLLPHLAEKARQRKVEAGKLSHSEVSPKTGYPPDDAGKASMQAAELVGLGKTSVESAIAIQKRDPEVVERMRAGDLNISQAARVVGLEGRGQSSGKRRTQESGERDSLGRNRPIYYGKGDRWKEAMTPIIRYLTAWEKRGFEYRHVNPKEARRRLALIEEVQQKLDAAKADLEQRAHSATLTIRKG